MKFIASLIPLLTLSLLSAFCGRSPSAGDKPLCIFAAAGTAVTMKEVAAEFTQKTGTPVVFNFANSGLLAKQIDSGATAHIFFSANEKWMDFVAEKGLIDPATRRGLLVNEMVLVVPKGKTIAVDFTQPAANQTFSGNFAIGDQSSPAGIYAKQALSKLGWWAPLRQHFCVGDTVIKTLNYVACKEADVGLVYRSVALCAQDRVDVVGVIPATLHEPIRFPIAASHLPHPRTAEFLQFIQSPMVQKIFTTYGWNLCKQEK